MKVGEILYFTPKYKFSELKWDDNVSLIDAFKNRVEGYYIRPAEKLSGEKDGFAAGVLLLTTVDFLARISIGLDGVRTRFTNWLEANVEEFRDVDPENAAQTLAVRFYDEFRNGFVHEGRIKNAGQFSYDPILHDRLVMVSNGIMMVNPDLLLTAVENSFALYLKRAEADATLFSSFRSALMKDFEKDVKLALRSLKG